MKNLLILSLLALSGYLGAMNSAENTKILYHGRSVQTLHPAFLWEKMQAEIIDIDGKSPEAVHAVIVASKKTYIYGVFKPEQLEKALSMLDSPKDTVSLMIKTGDPALQKMVEEYDPEVTLINFSETSYLEPTWRKLHGSEPTKGLQHLDRSQTLKPSRDDLAVREYYCTEAGGQLEQQKKVFWIIVDADQGELSSIIELGSAYLTKVESLDKETVKNTQLIKVNNSHILFANANFGWDRVKNTLLQKDIGNGLKAELVVFNKFANFNIGYQYGLRTNNPNINIIKIARHFGGNGWRLDSYSEAGFDSKQDIMALIEFLQSNAAEFGL
jgi:hypothetical protein